MKNLVYVDSDRCFLCQSIGQEDGKNNGNQKMFGCFTFWIVSNTY